MKAKLYRKVMYKAHPINITEWKLIEEELAELERLADIGKKYEHFEKSNYYCIRCERPVIKGKKYCKVCLEYENNLKCGK